MPPLDRVCLKDSQKNAFIANQKHDFKDFQSPAQHMKSLEELIIHVFRAFFTCCQNLPYYNMTTLKALVPCHTGLERGRAYVFKRDE